MFTLMANLYSFCRRRSERRCRLVCVGLDNAGKVRGREFSGARGAGRTRRGGEGCVGSGGRRTHAREGSRTRNARARTPDGQTTLVGAAQGAPPDEAAPTMGFQKATVTTSRFHVDVYDLGGGKRIRGIWKEYTAEVHACMFVVDAADPSRFDEAREVLHATLADEFMKRKPLLVFANKQDLDGAASSAALAEALGLATIADVRFHVVECSAKSGTGEEGAVDPNIAKGLQWLLGAVDSDFRKLNQRVEAEGAAMREKQEREKEERRKRAAAAREERRRQREREAAEAEAAGSSAAVAPECSPPSGVVDAFEPPPKPSASDAATPRAIVEEMQALSSDRPPSLPGAIASPAASAESLSLSRPEALPPLVAGSATAPASFV